MTLDFVTARQVYEGAQRAFLWPVDPQPIFRESDGFLPARWTWDSDLCSRRSCRDEVFIESPSLKFVLAEMEKTARPFEGSPGNYSGIAEPWQLTDYDVVSYPPSVTLAFLAGGTMTYTDPPRRWLQRVRENLMRCQRCLREPLSNAMIGSVRGTPFWEIGARRTWNRACFLPHWAIRARVLITRLTCTRIKDLSEHQVLQVGHFSPYSVAQQWDRRPRNIRYRDNPFVWVADFTLFSNK